MSTTTIAPSRSYDQRMEALRRANDIRSRRAQLKRDLKAGRRPVDELLLSPPAYLETAKVFDLLLAAPKYGRVKVNKLLAQANVSPSKTVGGLSSRQRRELVAFLHRRRGPAAPVHGTAASHPPVPCPIGERELRESQDARIRGAVRAACQGPGGWAFSWEVARQFGVAPRVMASRLSGAESRGIVEKRSTGSESLWRLPDGGR